MNIKIPFVHRTEVIPGLYIGDYRLKQLAEREGYQVDGDTRVRVDLKVSGIYSEHSVSALIVDGREVLSSTLKIKYDSSGRPYSEPEILETRLLVKTPESEKIFAAAKKLPISACFLPSICPLE